YVVKQDRQCFGQFKTGKGIMIGGFPLDDHEMSAYFRSPETFLGVFKQNPRRISDPYHCYEFAYNSYSKSKNEFLIENLKVWYPLPELKGLSHAELVRRYCLNVASMMWQDGQSKKLARKPDQ